MSEGGGPRRSARIANIARKRQAISGEERKPKRMKKSEPPSRASTSVGLYDVRLRDVLSFRAATLLIEEYLSSIQIDDDDPAFLFDWQEDNVNAFVAAANGLNAARAPSWLRTRPPHITAFSFIDDFVYRLGPPLAGGRFGHIILAPNNVQQYTAIVATLAVLQNDEFLQDAMRLALLNLPVVNNVVPCLAITAHLADSRMHNVRLNNLPPILSNNRRTRQLFI